MTVLRKINVNKVSGFASDAFGKLRTSEPYTIFDSKQIFDNEPLFWDDAETSGSGTSSSHSINTASTTISVSALTAGTRVRQTFQRFNYQPGKSQMILMTGVLGVAESGITQCIGYFDDENGVLFKCKDAALYASKRSYTTGSAVDTDVAQSSWNIDKMDGTGPSGITLDLSKTQIFLIDFEWLGVGSVRFGFVVDATIYYCHQMNHANDLSQVYMSTPNLPLRYEISNNGTAGASSVDHICSTVISEVGLDPNGVLRSYSTQGTHIDCNSANTAYAIVGLKLQPEKVGTTISIKSISVLCETSDDFEWFIVINPTLGSALSYSDLTNSSIQVAVGQASNPSTSTVTGGIITSGGFSRAESSVSNSIENSLKLGVAIDGTLDELVLAVRPLGANADVQGSITWREL